MRPIQQHVSASLKQSTSVLARQWSGLCVASCLALNWPLSTENLGAVKASLLSTYARLSKEASSGGPAAHAAAEWSTFARRVLADLKRDSGRTLMGTRWNWLNFLQSSLTRQIFSTRRTLLRSQKLSSSGEK